MCVACHPSTARYQNVCFGFGSGGAFSQAMRFFGDSPKKRGKPHGTSRYALNDLQTGFVAPRRKVGMPAQP
jgi:hypothetical protein